MNVKGRMFLKYVYRVLPCAVMFLLLPSVVFAHKLSFTKKNHSFEVDSLGNLPVDSVYSLFNHVYVSLTSEMEKSKLEDKLVDYLRKNETKSHSATAALQGVDRYNKSELALRLYLSVLRYLSGYYYTVLMPDSVCYYGQKGLRLATEHHINKFTGVFYNAFGSCYELRGDYTKAFAYYYRGLEIAEAMNDDDLIATNLLSLGFLFDITGQTEEAKKYYQQTVQFGKKHNLHWASETAQYNMNLMDTSLITSFKRDSLLLQRAIRRNDSLDMGYHLNNLGVDYDLMDSMVKSYQCYYKAYRIAEKLHDKPLCIDAVYNLASLFSDTTEWYNEDSAHKYMQLGFHLVKNGESLQSYSDFLFLSAYFDNLRKANKSAWLKINEYIRKEDSLRAASQDKEMYELVAKMEELRRQKERIRDKNRRLKQQVYFIVAIIFVALLLFVLFYFLSTADKRRKDIEDALNFVDHVLGNTNGYFIFFDAHLMVKYASSGFINDYCEDNITRLNQLLSLIHEEDRDLIQYKLEMVQQQFVDKNAFELRIYNREAEVRYVIGSISRVHGPEGFIINFWDDTGNKEIRMKVMESRLKYLKIFNSFPDIFFILDENAQISEVTPSVQSILGYHPQEVKGKLFATYFADITQGKTLRREIYLNNEVNDKKVILRKKDGTLFYGSLSGKLFVDKEESHLLRFHGVIRDLTERIKIMERLQEANNTKNKLFSVIAHDLVGPVGIQKNILDLIMQEGDTMDKDEMVGLIKPLKPSLDATYFMISNLMSWASIMREGVKQQLKVLQIYPVVEQVFRFIALQAQDKNIALKFEGNKKTTALFDKNMMEVIIRNLLSNAIKFSPEGGIVSVEVTPYDGKVRIAVKDQGVGIPSKGIDNLMKDTHQSFSTRGTRNEKGTGIGLIIVKEFLLKQNSRLHIESEENKGSTFYFYLKSPVTS